MPKTIVIGDKTVNDLTEQDIVEFLCYSGHIAALEYWEPPVITELDIDGNTAYFTVSQQQLPGLDNLLSFYRAHISLNQVHKSEFSRTPHRYCSYYSEKFGSKFFQQQEIIWFIEHGFYIELSPTKTGE